MANPEHVEILKKGVEVWNQWREEKIGIEPNLEGIDLVEIYLKGINLNSARLKKSNLSGADLRAANLTSADLSNAELLRVNLIDSNLKDAKLENANLRLGYLGRANLRNAKLSKANLIESNLSEANLWGVALERAVMRKADISRTSLINASLIETDLERADLSRSDLSKANMTKANLKNANLNGALLRQTILNESNLNAANLSEADLQHANLGSANLKEAKLMGANLSHARLSGCNFKKAILKDVFLVDIDLSEVLELETCFHSGPSTIDHRTLAKLRNMPVEFLRGIGLSDYQIEYYKLEKPNLSNAEINDIIYRIYDLRAHQAVQVSPLFISYSHADSAFVDALEPHFIEKGIRFWRDIKHSTAGRLERQVDRAMRLNPTVLLILSENSVESDWVRHEAESARELEKELKRDVLCPIALDNSWKDCDWPMRLRRQIKDYNILDFSQWQDEELFSRQFSRLVNGLDIYFK